MSYNMHTQTQKNTVLERDEFVLSANPERAIQEMMDTIDQLRSVYERETETLDNSDAKGFMAMQEEKLLAARNYQDGISQLLARKDEIRSVDPHIREKLQGMQAEFSTLAEKNMKALDRMQRCMNRFGDTLRQAVTDAARKERAFSYTASGKIAADEAKTISSGSISETA